MYRDPIPVPHGPAVHRSDDGSDGYTDATADGYTDHMAHGYVTFRRYMP